MWNSVEGFRESQETFTLYSLIIAEEDHRLNYEFSSYSPSIKTNIISCKTHVVHRGKSLTYMEKKKRLVMVQNL